jgi:uncharacterized membrane protein (DUF441 family)
LRSIVTVSLSILGIWTIITGIMDSDIHIFAACVLLVVICIHIWLNRNSFLQRFKGLGWKWILITTGILTAIASAAID